MSAQFHSPPFMPLYCGDYLRDTQRLSTEEHGAYLLLIMEYWVTGAPLPDDEVALSRVCRASVKQFRHLLPRLRIFFAVGDGFWRHKRIDVELAKAGQLNQFRHLRAKSGAAARWAPNATSNATSIALRMLEAASKQCPSQPQPLENPNPEASSPLPATLKKPRRLKRGSPLASPPMGQLRGEPSLVIDKEPPRPGFNYTSASTIAEQCRALGLDASTIKPLTAADAPAAKAGLYGESDPHGRHPGTPAVLRSDEPGGASSLPRALWPGASGLGTDQRAESRILPLPASSEATGPINGQAVAIPPAGVATALGGSGSGGTGSG